MSTKSALRADLDAEDRKTLAEDASRAADEIKPYRQPVLATGRVRYVGDPVAAVFAEDPYVAEDAADLVEVEIEPLSTLMSATDPPGALATSMRRSPPPMR
jgi:carbon-monoxide dehydrogenase large subunit/6-hydroxypseudooxynicotine dehydrogenase subunit gamma